MPPFSLVIIAVLAASSWGTASANAKHAALPGVYGPR